MQMERAEPRALREFSETRQLLGGLQNAAHLRNQGGLLYG